MLAGDCQMNRHLEHAQVLIQQDRNELAEQSLRLALAEEPDNAMAHSWLALVLTEQNRHEEAEPEANAGVRLEPENDYMHYIQSLVQYRLEAYEQGQDAVIEAIRINPNEAQYYAHLARFEARKGDWESALDTVNRGLQIDPEHVACNNLRGLFLQQFGRGDEAEENINIALSNDPESAMSHANLGWTLLRRSSHVEAARCFIEALRLMPTLDWAREGLIESLRSRNPLYRLLLRYFFWMSKNSRHGQLGLIIGAFLLFRILRAVADSNPEWAVFIWPFLGLYVGFVLITWIGRPVSDLILRLDPTGRLALQPYQIRLTNWIGGLLIVSILSVLSAFLLGFEIGYLAACIFAALVITLSAIYVTSRESTRRFWTGFAIDLGIVGVGALVLSILGITWDYVLYVLFFVGWAVFLFFIWYSKFKRGRKSK